MARHNLRRRVAALMPAILRSCARHSVAALVFTIASVLTAACGADRSSRPVATVRDSAGIVIVENSGSVAEVGGTWSIAPEPETEIGTVQDDPHYQLFRVAGATRLSDGRIAVGNGGSQEIRIFDSEGAFLAAFGGRGEGPEEFSRLQLMGAMANDTLVVMDAALRRISLLHPDGGFGPQARISDDVASYILPQGLFADGTILTGGAPIRGGPQEEGLGRNSTTYRSSNLDGSLATDFGEFPGQEFFFRRREGSSGPRGTATPIPFGKIPLVAAAPNRLFFGSGDEWEVEAYDLTGRLERVIRLDRPRVPVTDTDIGRLIEWMVDTYASSEEAAQRLRQDTRELPVAEFRPPFGALEADLLGYLWAEEHRLPGDEVRKYTIFDAEGRVAGVVTLPERVAPLEIGADYLLGLYRDEVEVEYVRMYRLERPEL